MCVAAAAVPGFKRCMIRQETLLLWDEVQPGTWPGNGHHFNLMLSQPESAVAQQWHAFCAGSLPPSHCLAFVTSCSEV